MTIKIKENLEIEVLSLKENMLFLSKNARNWRSTCFHLTTSKQMTLLTFYTGFPNVQTMMAQYEYLDPGVNGRNVKYWLSSQDDLQKAGAVNSVKQGRPRILTPSEEFFSGNMQTETGVC